MSMYHALNMDFDSEHRLAFCRPSGMIDEGFAIQLLNFLLALEEVCEPLNRVLDLTQVTGISLENSHIQEYAEGRRKATGHLEQFRTAIIAASPESEALARLYAMLMNGSKIEVGIFPDASSAATWLGVPQEVVRGLRRQQKA